LTRIQYLLTQSGGPLTGWVYAGENPILRFEGAPGAEVVSYYLEDASDSIRAVLNASGQVVAEYDYDAFGNTLGVANWTGAAGGDFGYHAAWRDSATGLYHMRARTYDPVTGRFTTPDPVDSVPQLPESYEPYSFANNNPQLFSDPTGLFTITEISVSINVSNSLDRLQTLAVNEAGKKGVEEAQKFAVDFLVDVIQKLTPYGSELRTVLEFARGGREARFAAADFFEELVSNLMCESVGKLFPDSLWLFPTLSVSDGSAITNGIGCGRRERTPRGDRSDVPSGKGASGTARPDYLISSGSPEAGDLTYLLGDVKLTGKALVDDYGGSHPRNLSQFQAIANHSVNYGLRISVFFTISPVAKDRLKELEELVAKTAIKNGAFAFVVSVF
jgi:RHS repeat-associated protein